VSGLWANAAAAASSTPKRARTMGALEVRRVRSEERLIGSGFIGLSRGAVSIRRSVEEREGTGETEEICDLLHSKEPGVCPPQPRICRSPNSSFLGELSRRRRKSSCRLSRGHPVFRAFLQISAKKGEPLPISARPQASGRGGSWAPPLNAECGVQKCRITASLPRLLHF
jgi:hypothetical protein